MRHMHYKGIRIPVFILSILINALGIDLIIVAGFGSSPISSVPIVISLYSNWTFGQITFFANILFIAAQIALLRRQFHPIEALQLGISVIFSVALDLYMPFFVGASGPFLASGRSDPAHRLCRPGLRHLPGSGLAGSHGSR